jgi:hypothetical protein
MGQSTGKCKGTLNGHTDSVECLGFAPEGGVNLVATGSMDGTAIIWDTTTMKQRCTLYHDNGDGVIKLAFHPTSPGLLYTCASRSHPIPGLPRLPPRAWWARVGFVLDAAGSGGLINCLKGPRLRCDASNL